MRRIFDFSGKTAIVTGGTRGIGRSIVELLCDGGASVIYTGTSASSPKEVPGARYEQLDLADAQSIAQFIERAVVPAHSIDILVNNAGINIIEPIDEMQDEHWEKILAVNLTGAMKIIRAVARVMKQVGQGKIVNISSIWGIISKPARGAYSASKTGLVGLTRAVALDLAPHGVLVNALCPGFTRTELTASTLSPQEIDRLTCEVPLGRFAEAEEIARAVLFLCSDWNTFITGQTIIVDGGFTIR